MSRDEKSPCGDMVTMCRDVFRMQPRQIHHLSRDDVFISLYLRSGGELRLNVLLTRAATVASNCAASRTCRLPRVPT